MPGDTVITGYALRLLGGASLESGGILQTGPATQRHRLALLAMLAASFPRGLTRDKLIGCLWPERDADPARNLLKQSVHVLRRALGEHAIVSAGEELRLGPDAPACDVIEFERALERREWEQAVRCYTGPFLDGFFLSEAHGFEQWADEQRQRLRASYRKALQLLADDRGRRGDWAGAVECLRRLLADEPCNAPVTLLLMRALDQSGDRAGALSQARVHATLLEQELGSGPDPKVMAMAESLRTAPAVPASAPPIATPGSEAPAEPKPRDVPTAARAARPATRVVIAALAVGLLAVAGWMSSRTFGSSRGQIQRIAVLPLANLTADPEQDVFAAGMHDALIAQLGQIEALTVLSRQSVLRYAGSDLPMPAIAREIGADALIEGSVLRSGDSVRVTIQLIQAQPETHLLASTHHGPVAQMLALQADIAREIARAIRARVTPAERARLERPAQPIDPIAQQSYLTGRYHIGRAHFPLGQDREPTLRTAIAALEKATTLAPRWAEAHAQLALAYHTLASGGFGRFEAEFYPKAKSAALRALALDENNAQAHASLGFVLGYYDWDWDGAERAIRRALELDPNGHHWIAALYYQAAGRHQDAIAHFHQAEERNPLMENLKHQLVRAYQCAGRHDEAIAQARDLHERVVASGRTRIPGDSIWFLDFTSRQYGLKGDHDRSIATAEQLLALTDSLEAGPTLALAYGLAGRREQARRLIDKQEAHALSLGGIWRPAQLYAAIGDYERALDMTEAALGTSRGGPATFRCTLTYRLLKDQPRMQEMLRQVGFPY